MATDIETKSTTGFIRKIVNGLSTVILVFGLIVMPLVFCAALTASGTEIKTVDEVWVGLLGVAGAFGAAVSMSFSQPIRNISKKNYGIGIIIILAVVITIFYFLFALNLMGILFWSEHPYEVHTFSIVYLIGLPAIIIGLSINIFRTNSSSWLKVLAILLVFVLVMLGCGLQLLAFFAYP